MQKSILLNKLKAAISEEEYRNLSANTIPGISQFNRETLLKMKARQQCSKKEIALHQVAALRAALEDYLGIYLSDNPRAWRWIILSCIYLRFICEVPMHPEALVHFEKVTEQGEIVYYCPCKSEGKQDVCAFCVCKGDNCRQERTIQAKEWESV